MGLFSKPEKSERQIAERKLAKSGLPEPYSSGLWAPYEASTSSGRRYQSAGRVYSPGEEPHVVAAGKTYLD